MEDVIIHRLEGPPAVGFAQDVGVDESQNNRYEMTLEGVLLRQGITVATVTLSDLMFTNTGEGMVTIPGPLEKVNIRVNGVLYKDCRVVGGRLESVDVGGAVMSGTVVYRGYKFEEKKGGDVVPLTFGMVTFGDGYKFGDNIEV